MYRNGKILEPPSSGDWKAYEKPMENVFIDLPIKIEDSETGEVAVYRQFKWEGNNNVLPLHAPAKIQYFTEGEGDLKRVTFKIEEW